MCLRGTLTWRCWIQGVAAFNCAISRSGSCHQQLNAEVQLQALSNTNCGRVRLWAHEKPFPDSTWQD
ncbi:hypothetical protein PR003_g17659 [Phytophthora rubi]|uniref:Secreted protein n=1 Tax=Phytophthora rubi TaxID=129364 RepID=A0A6A4EKT4_9STRA|nr:hypothetical protein PR002_g17148 [Phytophthora rubi]KAE9007425.1 hypothetical protein PR001_g16970 [Phytophthora rubi]KAE9320655.1 hypothetical protein PR003_g17659 [Phytophthora rubi]